jgi:hypothetical protein
VTDAVVPDGIRIPPWRVALCTVKRVARSKHFDRTRVSRLSIRVGQDVEFKNVETAILNFVKRIGFESITWASVNSVVRHQAVACGPERYAGYMN